jgi:hypothetical protein
MARRPRRSSSERRRVWLRRNSAMIPCSLLQGASLKSISLTEGTGSQRLLLNRKTRRTPVPSAGATPVKQQQQRFHWATKIQQIIREFFHRSVCPPRPNSQATALAPVQIHLYYLLQVSTRMPWHDRQSSYRKVLWADL